MPGIRQPEPGRPEAIGQQSTGDASLDQIAPSTRCALGVEGATRCKWVLPIIGDREAPIDDRCPVQVLTGDATVALIDGLRREMIDKIGEEFGEGDRLENDRPRARLDAAKILASCDLRDRFAAAAGPVDVADVAADLLGVAARVQAVDLRC